MSEAQKLSRDDKGLLVNPVIDYVFNEDGSVNWRKMDTRSPHQGSTLRALLLKGAH